MASEMGTEAVVVDDHKVWENGVATWTCFAKDDSEQDCVGCFAVCCDYFRELCVKMKDEAQSSRKAASSDRDVS